LGHIPRGELDRRGAVIQQRVVTEFSWAKQGERMTTFLRRVCAGQWEEELAEALAA
jgi:hypothetical protein